MTEQGYLKSLFALKRSYEAEKIMLSSQMIEVKATKAPSSRVQQLKDRIDWLNNEISTIDRESRDIIARFEKQKKKIGPKRLARLEGSTNRALRLLRKDRQKFFDRRREIIRRIRQRSAIKLADSRGVRFESLQDDLRAINKKLQSLQRGRRGQLPTTQISALEIQRKKIRKEIRKLGKELGYGGY